ncbi:Rz1-like lysis system protein LysC, partial [Salmonella enterica subsp. enterica serovar Paratyphi A]
FSIVLCPVTLASCISTETVVAPKVEQLRVPEAFTVPCAKADRRKWSTVKDIVGTATANEASLRACAAQVDGVRRWNAGTGAAK